MKKFETSSIKFAFFYSIYSYIVFNFIIFKKLYETLNPLVISDYLFLSAIFFVGFIATFLFFNLLFQKYVTKFFAILFCVASGFASYFIISYNVPIDTDMLRNAFATDVREAGDLLSFKMFFYILFFSVAPILLIYLTKIEHSLKTFIRGLKLLFIIIPLLVLLLISFYFKAAGFFRVNRIFGDLFTPFNYTLPIIKITKNKFFTKEEKDTEINDLTINDANKDLNIIFVVGETARKKNFQIYGYEKETTPELAKIKDLKILQNTVSCGTATRISMPCIFTPKNGYESYLRALKEQGVYIKWYENNYGGCYGMCQYLGIETFYSNHEKCEGSCPDGVIFEEFYKDFKTKQQGLNFYILHQNGSHGPLYFKRYPTEFAKFKPECTTANVNECSKESLINAYDNTIIYTDFLLAQLIETVKASGKPSVVIYISDHGESLGENGIFLHGFPYSVAPKEQKEIPFIIWSSFPLEVKEQEEYVHKNSMNLVLSLLGAKSSVIESKYNIIK